tara:strand:+ start:95 stop:340 length:246 start_codon:yes stop_codon:yes gene_type:complete
MAELKNKNVEVSLRDFSIKWNDKPLDRWDTYLFVSEEYKQKSKWQGCWDEIVSNFNEKTTPDDICTIVGKYGSYRGFYAAG